MRESTAEDISRAHRTLAIVPKQVDDVSDIIFQYEKKKIYFFNIQGVSYKTPQLFILENKKDNYIC